MIDDNKRCHPTWRNARKHEEFLVRHEQEETNSGSDLFFKDEAEEDR